MYDIVVAALEACINASHEGDCVAQKCPYYGEPNCIKCSTADTLEVLKKLKAENDKYREVVGKLVVRDDTIVTVLADKETKYVPWGISRILQDLARKSGKEKALEELSKMLLDTKFKIDNDFVIYANNVEVCANNLLNTDNADE